MALVQNGSEPASPRVARLTRRTEDTPITALGCSYVISAPNNVGAAFRNAAGLGADAVLVTPRCADPLYRRSVRVSMGTVFQVPWTRLPAWRATDGPNAGDLLHADGFHIAAMALTDEAMPLDEFAAQRPERVAFVMGSEGPGLDRSALAAADTTVVIPMTGGVDSLNVAAASAVALWALR